jgi:hypothetical protein
MTDRIIQIGNFVPPRKGFENPQDGRVYSTEGIAPMIRVRNTGEYFIAVYE